METKEYTENSSNLLMSLLSEPIMCSFVQTDVELVPGITSKPPVYKKMTQDDNTNLQLDLNLYTIPESSSEEHTHRSEVHSQRSDDEFFESELNIIDIFTNRSKNESYDSQQNMRLNLKDLTSRSCDDNNMDLTLRSSGRNSNSSIKSGDKNSNLTRSIERNSDLSVKNDTIVNLTVQDVDLSVHNDVDLTISDDRNINLEDLKIEDIEDEININDVEKQTDMILQDLQKEQIQLTEIVSDLDRLFSESNYENYNNKSMEKKGNEIETEPVLDKGLDKQQSKMEVSTFSDIVTILEELEKENIDSKNKECGRTTETPRKYKNLSARYRDTVADESPKVTCKDYSDLLSYLDEIDQNCIKSIQAAKRRVQSITELTTASSGLRFDTIPKIDDLLQHTTVELANYVVDLAMRLEDKTCSVALLKSEVSKFHQLIANSEQDRERIIKQKLLSEKNKYEPVIKRHQTFIDQLIADKKELNDKCERLMSEIKTAENRHSRNLQAIEQRHKVEIKRCREMHEAAEKVKREKWMELKTNKIKEMTAKSVEHDIVSMNDKYQKEIYELKMSHKREIEELELKAARKTQQQCELLREQLTIERENSIANEREALKHRFEKLVESEEKGYQEQKRRLKEEHLNKMEELKDKERILESEKDAQIKTIKEDCEERLETARRRHEVQINNVKESVRLELDMWKNNYMKQQSGKLNDLEKKLRDSYRKERDREIEMVIDRLERESEQTKRDIESSAENRLRRLKDKYEEEISLLKKEEKEYKAKQELIKAELIIQEETIRKLKMNLSDLQDEKIQLQKMSDKLSVEKKNLRDIIRQEFIMEIKCLKDELNVLTNQKEKELQDIYMRVKSSISRKDEQIKKITQDNTALHEKCKLLENMLEQQRRDYLIR